MRGPVRFWGVWVLACVGAVVLAGGSGRAWGAQASLWRAKVAWQRLTPAVSSEVGASGSGRQSPPAQGAWLVSLHEVARDAARHGTSIHAVPVGQPPLRWQVFPAAIVEHSPVAPGPFDRVEMAQIVGSWTEVEGALVGLGISGSAMARQARARPGASIRNGSSGDDTASAEPADEVVTLVQAGDSKNRIDLVFMGDGYTAAERERFFADARRLTGDLFSQRTFSSYLPIFNVHAVFRASRQSGLGRGQALDTAYRLYREGNTLRAIFPGNPQALRDSCAAAPDCDFPVVLANDDNYGGLGGEFAITTRSLTSGAVVLRHELGHNFGSVGEEYDGGGYFGRNHSASVRSLSWEPWLAVRRRDTKSGTERALALGWPWTSIAGVPFVVPFRSADGAPHARVRLSLSGVDGEGGYSVTLDGEKLEVPVLSSPDRSFIDLVPPDGFAAGEHELRIEAPATRSAATMSSLTVHEYDEDPDADPGRIGAFPVFGRDLKVAGYRPTREACLMRNMLHPDFCPVCQENNWRELLGRIALVDAVAVEPAAGADGGDLVTLRTLELGQFRKLGKPRFGDEQLQIRWFLGGRPWLGTEDRLAVTVPASERAAKLEVLVSFVTPEVRESKARYAAQRLVIKR